MNPNDYCRLHLHSIMKQVAVLLTALLLTTAKEKSCPGGCICNLKVGLYNCTDVHLHTFPSVIPVNTLSLQLSNAHVSSLEHIPTLPHLETFVFSKNDIRDIQADLLSSTPILKILDVSSNKLVNVPQNIPKTLLTLNLNDNRIRELEGHLTHLVHLTEFYIEENALGFISQNNFPSPNFIVKVSFAKNFLSSLEDNLFSNFRSLKALSLSGNRLVTVNEKLFSGLKHLVYLDLSHNQLSHIPDKTFLQSNSLKYLYLKHNHISVFPKKLPYLEWLDISYNNIRNINASDRGDIYPIEMFNLGNNPLHCDCSLLWLKELWDTREFHVDLKQSNDFPMDSIIPSCQSPEMLHGETWDHLANEMFTCVGEKTHQRRTIKTSSARGEEAAHPPDRARPSEKTNIDLPPIERKKEKTKRQIQDAYETIKQFQEEQAKLETSNKETLEIHQGSVSSSQVTVTWSKLSSGHVLNKVYVKYWIDGAKSSTTLIAEMDYNQFQYTIINLQPDTHYVVCVLLRMSGDANPGDDSCLQVATLADDTPTLLFLTNNMFFHYFKVFLTCFMLSVFIIAVLICLYEVFAYFANLIFPKEHHE